MKSKVSTSRRRLTDKVNYKTGHDPVILDSESLIDRLWYLTIKVKVWKVHIDHKFYYCVK